MTRDTRAWATQVATRSHVRGRLRLLILLVGVVCSLVGAACKPEGPARPNILLVSLDTTRADHTSLHGYARDTTPNLVSLGAAGTRFDAAYSPTSTTGPTHASVFTSRYPVEHGVVKNGLVLAPKWQTLGEVFRAAGYETAGMVGSFVLDEKFGYAQGFDTWDDEFDPASSRHALERWEGHDTREGFDRPGRDVTDRALAWLEEERDADKPFLLFLHYFDAHNPYTPPDRFFEKFWNGDESQRVPYLVALYDGGIAYADHELGRVFTGLSERDVLDDTIVVVFGDHGEGLMQHGLQFHGEAIYEEQVRVPFVIRWPERVAAGRVEEGPIELLDVAPTLFELVGLERPVEFSGGRSLVPSLGRGDSGRGTSERPIYLYRRRYDSLNGPLSGEHFGLRRGRWKLIDARDEGRRELYDLERDPGERRNLVAARMDVTAFMQEALDRWRSSLVTREDSGGELSAEDRARLEALGYAE